MMTESDARKYVSEFLGTFVLVFIGCGSAVAVSGCAYSWGGVSCGCVAVA